MFSELEDKVINKLKNEMFSSDSKDTVSKLYRQARLWVRFHWYYEGQCGEEHAQQLNLELKKIHYHAKKRLEEKQCKKSSR